MSKAKMEQLQVLPDAAGNFTLLRGEFGSYEGFKFIESPLVKAPEFRSTVPYYRRFERRRRR